MISVILPVYHNEETLVENLSNLNYISYLTERVIVFDGYSQSESFADQFSRTPSKTKIISNYPDVPWGNARARNLGAINASREWLLFLDVDHTFKTEWTSKDFLKDNVYRFKRNHEEEIKWPSGSILIHRDLFFKIGGYNEKFCGNYGYEDIELLYRVHKNGNCVVNSEIEISVLPSGKVNLPRDTKVNRKLFETLRN